jgi:hypothetical protein
MFARRHEQDLAEIKALADELESDDAGPLLAFVHIPKTAGGTVTSMLAAAYSKRGIAKTGNYIKGPEKTVRKVTRRPGAWESWHRGGGRVAVGHTPYGVFRDHLPADARYMTFLREPVDRVLSHYYRHVHNPALSDPHRNARRQGRRATAASIEEALIQMRLPQLTNLATRFLCSHPSLGVLPASALEDAKENLRKFAFVGIQERFEESIVLLQRALGLGFLPYLDRHVSVEGGRPAVDEISDAQRSLIEEYNQLDTELYRFGLELFADAVAAAGEGIAADVERLRGVHAAATDERQTAIQKARDWLDRELPPGTKEPVVAVRARAEAAGVSWAALNATRKQLQVRREQDEDGAWRFVRGMPRGRRLARRRAAGRRRPRTADGSIPD